MICGIGNGKETGTRAGSGTEGRICIALVLVLVLIFARIRIDLEDMILIDQATSQALLDSSMPIPGLRTIGHPHRPLLGYLPRSPSGRQLLIEEMFIPTPIFVPLSPPLVRAETSREKGPPSHPPTSLRNVEVELHPHLYRNSSGLRNHLSGAHHALHRHSYQHYPRQSTSRFHAIAENIYLPLKAAGLGISPSDQNSSYWISTALWSIATSRPVRSANHTHALTSLASSNTFSSPNQHLSARRPPRRDHTRSLCGPLPSRTT
jgi:hypothetical protein